MANNSEPKHNHAEAFRLMRYVCEDCGYSEIVWNSRDGVTPFGMMCRRCRSINMMHHNWDKDVYAPDHIPHQGQGIWIDMPESLKPTLARMRAAVFEGPDEERESLIQALIEDMGPGTPWLIRWGA